MNRRNFSDKKEALFMRFTQVIGRKLAHYIPKTSCRLPKRSSTNERRRKKYYLFEQVEIEIKEFKSEGYILDIGGGGEGVIGRLKGKNVVAIDFRKEELEEAADGPLKIVMDARELQFLDNSFQTATAFFSLMYLKTQADQQKVLEEVGRVLKPGGYLHIWDVDLSEQPETDKEIYLVHLRYKVGGSETETGYGQRWPKENRSKEYYIELAEKAGFRHMQTEKNKHTFYLLFQNQSK